jgi:hypothetical protein
LRCAIYAAALRCAQMRCALYDVRCVMYASALCAVLPKSSEFIIYCTTTHYFLRLLLRYP